MAALRVSIGSFLQLDVYLASLLCAVRRKGVCAGTTPGGFAMTYAIVRKAHLIRIGDTTFTVLEAEIVMPSPSDQRPATGADIRTRH
jgi:hypothetical protein